MKIVNFREIKPGSLVQVPRTQFSKQRYGWNGWLFSSAVVLDKGVSKKTGKNIIKVEMYLPAPGKHLYCTKEAWFNADCVFYEPASRIRGLLAEWGVNTKEEFVEFLSQDGVSDMSETRFLVDKGFVF